MNLAQHTCNITAASANETDTVASSDPASAVVDTPEVVSQVDTNEDPAKGNEQSVDIPNDSGEADNKSVEVEEAVAGIFCARSPSLLQCGSIVGFLTPHWQ